MNELTVSLMVRYKDTAGKWKRGPAARGKNGKVRPGFVMLNGAQAEALGATYELRSYEERQAKYTPAGRNAAAADALCRRMQRQKTIKAEAEKAGVQVIDEPDRKRLSRSATEYISDCEARGAREATVEARQVTEEFVRVTRKTFLDELDRADILKYHAVLRERGLRDRTVSNRHNRLRFWFKFAGIDRSFMPPTPRFEKQLPTKYSSDQIKSILEAADDYMRLAILIALKCGLRDLELRHLEWRDIDWDGKVLRVRSKPQYDFKVKDSEQRDIPVPSDVLIAMKERRKTHGECSLVLATSGRLPNRKLLRTLKRLAHRAGLNCGMCSGCVERNECREWELHKFRRTFATNLLRNDVDIRTVQMLMGHADLDSTLRYLAPAESSEIQDKINSIKW